jgi:tRNA (cmo5U34)-methyltransferase
MPEDQAVDHFDESRAARYDERFARLAPMRDALHFLAAMALRDLPDDAHVLCVGAGTGAELLALAAHFPGWRFVAVDPSGPMLAICRQRAEAAGILARCEFHEGFVSGLRAAPEFHAATSILVSQFITEATDRIAFFSEIATRLLPGGRLITADLSTGAFPQQHEQRVDVWRAMLKYSGVEAARIAEMANAWKRDVAILPACEIESLLVRSGFEAPVLIAQTLLIHAWLTRRAE